MFEMNEKWVQLFYWECTPKQPDGNFLLFYEGDFFNPKWVMGDNNMRFILEDCRDCDDVHLIDDKFCKLDEL